MYIGKNRGKLVQFKEQKNIFCIFKTPTLSEFRHSVYTAKDHYRVVFTKNLKISYKKLGSGTLLRITMIWAP
jgi:hypothetical protein